MRLLAAILLAVFSVVAGAVALAGAQPPTAGYICPMHPQVRSDRAGTCAACGMTLVDAATAVPGRHALEVEWDLPAPRAGHPAQLRLLVGQPDRKEIVRAFEEVHERLFHLFVVSWDLEHFAHMHPALQADGAMAVTATLPHPGAYQLYADFLPAGGFPQVVQTSVFTEGVSPASAALARARARHLTREVREGVDRGVRVRIEPAALVAGRVEVIAATFEDATTGAPLANLEPYLGAWGHALIVSADLADAVHSHPVTPLTSPGGPRIFFSQRFPRAGFYRMWLQVQRRGEVATVPFTLEVS